MKKLLIILMLFAIPFIANSTVTIYGTDGGSGGGTLGAGNWAAMDAASPSEGDTWWLTDQGTAQCTTDDAGVIELMCAYNSSGVWVPTGIAGGTDNLGNQTGDSATPLTDVTGFRLDVAADAGDPPAGEGALFVQSDGSEIANVLTFTDTDDNDFMVSGDQVYYAENYDGSSTTFGIQEAIDACEDDPLRAGGVVMLPRGETVIDASSFTSPVILLEGADRDQGGVETIRVGVCTLAGYGRGTTVNNSGTSDNGGSELRIANMNDMTPTGGRRIAIEATADGQMIRDFALRLSHSATGLLEHDPAATNNDVGIFMNTAGNFTIKNVNIRNPSGSNGESGIGVEVVDSQKSMIDNLWVASLGMGLKIGNGTDTNNAIVIQNSTFRAGNYGIYYEGNTTRGTGGCSDNTVIGGTTEGNSAYGFFIEDDSYCNVRVFGAHFENNAPCTDVASLSPTRSEMLTSRDTIPLPQVGGTNDGWCDDNGSIAVASSANIRNESDVSEIQVYSSSLGGIGVDYAYSATQAQENSCTDSITCTGPDVFRGVIASKDWDVVAGREVQWINPIDARGVTTNVDLIYLDALSTYDPLLAANSYGDGTSDLVETIEIGGATNGTGTITWGNAGDAVAAYPTFSGSVNATQFQASTSVIAPTIQAGGATADGSVVIFDENGASDFKVTIEALDGLAADYTLVLPPDDGTTDGQQLTTNGSGVLRWDTGGGGGTGAFDDTTDPVDLLTSTKNVVIGTSIQNTSKLTIDGDDNQVQLTVQANATQSDSVVIVETSAGTQLVNIDVNGNVLAQSIEDIDFPRDWEIDVNGNATFASVSTPDSDTGENRLTDLNGDEIAIDLVPGGAGDATMNLTVDDATPADDVVYIQLDGATQLVEIHDVFDFQKDGVMAFTATLNDNLCDTEGEMWYDTNDNAFEFCQAASGVPSTLGGGGTPNLSTIVDDVSCAGSEIVRRNAGDTAFECTTPGGGGTVTSSGAPLVNQVAVFTSPTDIDSESTFTWDATTLTIHDSTIDAGGVNIPGAGDSLDIGSDPADAGAVRLGDDANITWEGTSEVSLTSNTSDVLEVDNTQAGISLVTTTATECVMLDAAAINCATTTGCETADNPGTGFDYTVADFEGTTDSDEDGAWSFQVPDNIAGSTFVANYVWQVDTCTASTNDDVCFGISSVGISPGASFDAPTFGTTIWQQDTCTTADFLYESPDMTVTHGWVAGERAIVKILRDNTTPWTTCTTDDVLGDARLHAVKVCYEVNNVFSGE